MIVLLKVVVFPFISWKDATFALIGVSVLLLAAVIVLLILYNKRRSATGKYKQSIDA